MQTLTNGYKKPETNDKGPIVFPALEDNIQRLNDHTHDGSNSEILTPAAIAATTQAVASGSWGALTLGQYSQSISMPAGIVFNNVSIRFQDDASGDIVYPTVVKTGASAYNVFVNDNTLNLTAVYK